MKCRDPFVTGGSAFGCGQCIPCRINKRREWTHRILLEAAQTKDNCFLTLTYDDEHLPEGGTLVPRDLRLFFWRLRKKMKFRYFGVGEYGDDSQRPHYHVALFGVQSCLRGLTSPRRNGTCCEVCDSMRLVWKNGNVYLGSLTEQSAAYIAGYVTKKMTAHDDIRLNGRYPEFARMSLRPGIGAGMMDDLASVLLDPIYSDLEDVPSALEHGRTKWPLGRYLRQQLRYKMGKEKKAPETTLKKQEEKLLPMRLAARLSISNPSFKQHVIEAGKGARINLEAKAHRRRKRSTL